MQIYNAFDAAESGLVEIGGEFLAGSGFESEQPDGDFSADVINIAAAQPGED
jgi:hypothetical protein